MDKFTKRAVEDQVEEDVRIIAVMKCDAPYLGNCAECEPRKQQESEAGGCLRHV
jgi:hypothetical protein